MYSSYRSLDHNFNWVSLVSIYLEPVTITDDFHIEKSRAQYELLHQTAQCLFKLQILHTHQNVNHYVSYLPSLKIEILVPNSEKTKQHLRVW